MAEPPGRHRHSGCSKPNCEWLATAGPVSSVPDGIALPRVQDSACSDGDEQYSADPHRT
jgi:hypothetical protein